MQEETPSKCCEGQNHHQIQSFLCKLDTGFWTERTQLWREWTNVTITEMQVAFRDERKEATRGIYTHCCHNGNIIEQASVYPVDKKGLVDGSDELSVAFKNNIKSYQCFNGAQIVQSTGRGIAPNSWPNLSQDLSHLHQQAGGENTNTIHFSNIITCMPGMCVT
ncbi:hypothetical protein AVEN_220150-1 [Araneus ventricosus]|uniref:Uncharacterized protein n=1 Tax=Araneus ventricosus TaxID=182803 RepID=A0A4Y2ULX8_ARAVE|nr:hypothetical protein AVEN_220150-1 [Araneus ventricosus]